MTTHSIAVVGGGTMGETIQVKNVDSGRVISGRVQADGRIRIGIY